MARPRGGEQVGAGDAEQVAEQQLLEPRRHLGREREQRAGAEQRGDGHGDAEVGADPLVARRERDRAGGDERAPGGADHQRRAGQRGEHEPGQQPVAHRLGRVGLAVQQHPDAERAEGEREDEDLEQRAAGDRVGEHQCSWPPCSWCSTATAVVPSGSTTSSPP